MLMFLCPLSLSPLDCYSTPHTGGRNQRRDCGRRPTLPCQLSALQLCERATSGEQEVKKREIHPDNWPVKVRDADWVTESRAKSKRAYYLKVQVTDLLLATAPFLIPTNVATSHFRLLIMLWFQEHKMCPTESGYLLVHLLWYPASKNESFPNVIPTCIMRLANYFQSECIAVH